MTAQEQLENEHRRRNSGFLLWEIALVCIGHLVSHFVVVKVQIGRRTSQLGEIIHHHWHCYLLHRTLLM